MKFIFVTLLFLHLGLCAFTQHPAPQGLAIGDTVPDLVFKRVYNHLHDTLRLADYRNKLVILDFWNMYCTNCLHAFPKIDSLQHEYDDQIQIFAVSKTGFQETVDFFKKFPNVHRPAIPFITGDTVLADLFPHQGDPYHVWISPAGRVLHLASGAYLTRARIDSALAGESVNIPSRARYTTYLPTLLDTAYDREITYASYLVRQNSVKNFRIERRPSANEYTASGSIQRLYQGLYRSLGNIQFDPDRAGRTLLMANRPRRYALPEGFTGEAAKQWADENMYFYQGRVPLVDSSRLFEWVKVDFDRYFDVFSTVEKREVMCWVLMRTDSVDRLRSNGGQRVNTLRPDHIRSSDLPPIRQLQNVQYPFLSSWITRTMEELTGQPCFDETAYAGYIDIALTAETLNQPTIAGLRKALNIYGLDLVSVSKQLDVLVLYDNTW